MIVTDFWFNVGYSVLSPLPFIVSLLLFFCSDISEVGNGLAILGHGFEDPSSLSYMLGFLAQYV